MMIDESTMESGPKGGIAHNVQEVPLHMRKIHPQPGHLYGKDVSAILLAQPLSPLSGARLVKGSK